MQPPKRTDEERPRFPTDCAFVVQFQGKHPDDRRPGRVEHLASGRAARFENAHQFWDFVSAVLSELEKKPVSGEQGARICRTDQ